MRILPKTPAQQIRRLSTLIPNWSEHHESIGLSPERVARLEELLAQARAAELAAHEARNAARAATLAFEVATAELMRQASSAIRTIKSTASISGTPSEVLSEAQLPAPKLRGRIAAPGTPTNFTFTLQPTGPLELKWECKNPTGSAGTMYTVRRQLTENGPFEHIATRGVKHFTDATIPAGTASVTYEIMAFRSTRSGAAGRGTVCFGNLQAARQRVAA